MSRLKRARQTVRLAASLAYLGTMAAVGIACWGVESFWGRLASRRARRAVDARWAVPHCTCGKTVMCPACEVPWIPIRPDGSHQKAYADLHRLYNAPLVQEGAIQ